MGNDITTDKLRGRGIHPNYAISNLGHLGRDTANMRYDMPLVENSCRASNYPVDKRVAVKKIEIEKSSNVLDVSI